MQQNQTLNLPEKLYPEIALPKWMTTPEEAIINIDDL